ncbi:transposase [Paenibacillus abyssi]|uniref:Transposase n=1 Tax=Paenibacillus abyssi TaxID=1340531 RepID=A0A917G0F3_9BACL|nr:transposase [Paenibacillus abyssi]GGG16334.1 hypothetical protein GCM10010916_36570 [Paenibacillus abyssi]
MKRYDKAFKEEAVRLSDEIGPKKAAEQLGVAYHTLQDWRKRRTLHGEGAHIGSGRAYASADKTVREIELEKEPKSLVQTASYSGSEICKCKALLLR